MSPLLQFKGWWRWSRQFYIYDCNFRINRNAWYRFYSRSKLWRDICDLRRERRFQAWIRYAVKHNMWITITPEYLDRHMNPDRHNKSV